MISAEQLAEALSRIDPHDSELLSLSLRRRVPDEALGSLYDCAPAEVARRRAAAIERLADELGIQRGEDLGAVLKALLEPETWAVVAGGERAAALGEEFGAPTASGGAAAAAAAAEPAAPPDLEPRVFRLRPAEEVEPDPEPVPPLPVAEAPEGPPAPPEDPPKPDDPPEPPAERPPAAGAAAAAAAAPAAPAGPERRRWPIVAALAGIAALIAGAGFAGAALFGGEGSTTGAGRDDGTRPFVPEERGALAAPFPSEPEETSCYPTALVRGRTVLRDAPGGEPLVTIAPKTEWASPRVLGIVRQEEGWLAVLAPELPNNVEGWIPRETASVDCVRWSLHADLSRRMLYVRKDGHTVQELSVAIGSDRHPTPEGRFAVTDKLKVTDPGSPYGCCVLALTGHQTNLPDDWPGGDRLAVHATTDLSSIGKPASLGCMRTTSERARWLIETIPLGAPIFIRA